MLLLSVFGSILLVVCIMSQADAGIIGYSVGTDFTFCEKSCHRDSTCEYKGPQDDGRNKFECNCNAGFTGDGGNCTDIDECTGSVFCDSPPRAKCVNTPGSYECHCLSGYRDNPRAGGTGLHCDQIDECTDEKSSHACDETLSTCRDLPGTYSCDCNDGYTNHPDNNKICVDVDECELETHNCNHTAKCVNTVGSYKCECLQGFIRDTEFSCKDYSMCEEEDNLCDNSTSTCVDKIGNYECQCSTGYDHKTAEDGTKDMQKCVDVNECELKTDRCDKFAHCDNEVGSYTCRCMYGYSGDGFNCTELPLSLGDLMDSLEEISYEQLKISWQLANQEMTSLRYELEKVKRICDLHRGGIHDNHNHPRSKRQAIGLPGESKAQAEIAIETLKHHNKQLRLQIEYLKKTCGIVSNSD